MIATNHHWMINSLVIATEEKCVRETKFQHNLLNYDAHELSWFYVYGTIFSERSGVKVTSFKTRKGQEDEKIIIIIIIIIKSQTATPTGEL